MCWDDEIKWFKCHNSDDFYTTTLAHSGSRYDGICVRETFDALCPSDPYFYQACGHDGCSGLKVDEFNNTLLCSTYICKHNAGFIESGSVLPTFFSCDNQKDCSNTDMDEEGCSNDTMYPDQELYRCADITNRGIRKDRVCDNKCDCYMCDDESFCNRVSYGVFCERLTYSHSKYVRGVSMCDGKPHCKFAEDESSCDEDHVVRQCRWREYYVRNLTAPQICDVPAYLETCSDGMDQVNCTDPKRVALTCKIKGDQSNVSIFTICRGYGLCDDGYEDNCFEIENGCLIHKNLLCDGVPDCDGEADEKTEICSILSQSNSCKRRLLTHDNLRNQSMAIPVDWVFDGVKDCEGGEDEEAVLWTECGEGATLRYSDKGTNCEDVLLCTDLQPRAYVPFSELCDKINTCGSENGMCEQSRGHFSLGGTEYGENKSLHYCLRGLGELVKLGPTPCDYNKPFESPRNRAYFVSNNTLLDIPSKDKTLDCSHTYGETYVFLTCSNKCENSVCPLKPVTHDTCINRADKVYSITEENTLTVLYRHAGQYHDDVFPCQNKRCVLYKDVCNLVDDCGDGSDERDCSNHFLCPKHGEYIPISAKCDGFVHCRDFADECNEDCPKSQRFILSHLSFQIASWALGFAAILLNGHVIYNTFSQLAKCSSFQALMNKILIALVAAGDSLMGFYLVAIAYYSHSFGDEYCEQKFNWLSSAPCAALGALQCVASQISILSMTFLSIYRLAWIDVNPS